MERSGMKTLFVHLASAWRHSRDGCSWAFSVFHSSSTSVYHTERKLKNKNLGGLGTRLVGYQSVLQVFPKVYIYHSVKIVATLAPWRSQAMLLLFTTVARCLSSCDDHQRLRLHAAVGWYPLRSAEWELLEIRLVTANAPLLQLDFWL